MLRKLQLVNYRSFRNFTVTFPGSACLVGPNNAGKSTILTALRLADTFIRLAHARKATRRRVHRDAGYFCHAITLSDFPSLRESLRHEFRNQEARLELTWTSGNKLVAIWPTPEDDYDDFEGFFFLQLKSGEQPTNIAVTKANFPRLGIVPILSPVDHTELILSTEHVRRNLSSRLSSRHFRNQLRDLQNEGQFDAYRNFAEQWLPGVRIDELDQHETDDGMALDLFMSESGSRVPKELIWAGDGIQVWLQILFHLFRLHDRQVIVLDEPDVYLHADLQRRLVQLLESLDSQTIIATHSAEVVAEAPRSSVVWVDKSRRSAKGLKDEALLGKLTGALGSQFNLKLAKAMKSRVLLMVEGQDMQLLRRLCRTIGADHLALEDGVTIVMMNGYSHHEQIDHFKWILDDFLADSVECFAFFDRDYRPTSVAAALESKLSDIGVHGHVWRRKELESYLLSPEAIGRLSGASEREVKTLLDEEAACMENAVFSRMLDERLRAQQAAKAHAVTITGEFKAGFDAEWQSTEWRLEVAPPKQLISAVNRRLQSRKFKAVSAERLASSLRAEEIPAELRGALMRVEHAVSEAGY